jgi:cytochrome b
LALALRGLARGREPAEHTASGLFMAAALLFRYAWVGAGKRNAGEDRVVAEMARSRRHGH